MSRLKKTNADPSDIANYRLISNLTFMSKVVERLVCRQLVAYLEQHSLLPSLQSAYRKQPSTETAVLKVVSDVLLAADRGDVTLPGVSTICGSFALSPNTENGCSQDISPCFYNQSRGLLQQCLWQCQCHSFESASIGVARCCAIHYAEKKV